MKYISLAGREHNHEKARSICQRTDTSEDSALQPRAERYATFTSSDICDNFA
jgi:hypothetical protein